MEQRTELKEAQLGREKLSRRGSDFKNNGAFQLSWFEAASESEEKIHHLADLG